MMHVLSLKAEPYKPLRAFTEPPLLDDNAHTPMHAEASYGHYELLDHLISRGDDVNITDEDGDTPLYTVERTETARWHVEHGARYDHVNAEGLTPAQHLEEDYPDIASCLTSLAPPQTINANTSPHTEPHFAHPTSSPRKISASETSEYHALREAEGLTNSLLSSVNVTMM